MEGDIYVPNPLSAGFSVEKLIRKLEGQSPPSDLGRVELKGRDDQVFGRRAGADWVENGRGAPSFTSSWGSKEPQKYRDFAALSVLGIDGCMLMSEDRDEFSPGAVRISICVLSVQVSTPTNSCTPQIGARTARL